MNRVKNHTKKIRIFLLAILAISLLLLTIFVPFYQQFSPGGIRGATVEISPGSDINAIIQTHPAGTTFLLKAGIHRHQEITAAQNGDTFIGEYIDANNKAVMSGAKVLTGWVQDGGNQRWYVTGQTQQSAFFPPSDPWTRAGNTYQICQNGFRSLCIKNEDLFVNNVRIDKADSIANVSSTKWYFDYNADRIYIGENPSGKTIETSVTDYAFNIPFSVSNITVKNLVIEKYATPAQQATVTVRGPNSVIEYNTVRLNHGTGISIGYSDSADRFRLINTTVRNNLVEHNGFLGFGGNGVNITFENNEVAYNNEEHFHTNWDGGGSKWVYTDNLVVRNNYSHHNDGNGFWTDYGNINSVYEDNILMYNKKHGLQHEISYSAHIEGNYIAYNDNYQIYVNNSGDVDILDNDIVLEANSANDGGIILQNSERNEEGPFGLVYVHNMDVNFNRLYTNVDNGRIAGLAGATSTTNPTGAPPEDFPTAAATTRFNYNTYYVPNANSSRWSWGGWWSMRSFSGFQGQGQEANGTVVTSGYTLPSQPTWNVPTGPQSQGTGAGVCGDGVIQNPNSNGIAEQCDDDNTNNNDGCSATCQIEAPVSNLEGWKYRKRIIVDNTKVLGSTDHSDFVMLVSLTADADLAARALDSGNDIVFASADGITILPHDQIAFNGTTGALTAWVKIPSLSVSNNTDIYLYYGNPSVTGSQSQSSNVWTAYKGVWHMEENPSTAAPQILDSTNNNNRGTAAGTMVGGDLIAGKISSAINFDGTDDAISMGDPVNGSLDVGTEDFTLQAWVRTNFSGASQTLLSKGALGGTNHGYKTYINSSLSNRPGMRIQSATNATESTPGAYANTISDGNWHLLTITFDRDNVATVIIDNSQKTTLTISTTTQSLESTQPFYIGRAGNGIYWNGDLDEIKVRNGALTLEWVQTEYNNQNDPSTFYSLQSEENLDPTYCGDGIVTNPNDNGIAEMCDDGNLLDNDSCSMNCLNACAGNEIWNGTVCIDPLAIESGSDYFILQAENYKSGGSGVGYNDLSIGNAGGAYRNDDVDIKEIEPGIFVNGWNQTGEWIEFEVNVPQTAVYNLVVRAASGESNGGILGILVDGNPFATVNIPNTESYESFILIDQTGNTITAGTHTIRFNIVDQWFDLDYVRFEVPAATCGDDNIDAGNNEQCDDGVNNGVSCIPSYGGSCNYCSNSCTIQTVQGAFCGDSISQTGNGEQCDDGVNNGVSCTPAYGDTCNYCNSSCSIQTVTGLSCGDGLLDNENEDCDDGINNGVTCTPGYNSPCNYCSNSCEIVTVNANFCGDTIIQAGDGEQCDDGNNNGIVCTPTYGNSCNYCDNSCQTQVVQGGNCGDNITQFGSGEQCDAGANNGNVCTPTYNNSCTYCNNSCINTTVQGIRCGDEIVQTGNGEQCDNGANNGAVCSPAYGASCNYCNISCTTETVTGAYCGDGVTQTSEGEQCDDGNTNNGDSCTSTCQNVASGGSSGSNSSSGGSTGTSGTLTRESKPLSTTTAHCGAMDINTDNKFTLADFSIFAQVYGKRCVSNYVSVGSCGSIDSNNDGRITLIDFATFANRFGEQRNCNL